MNKWNAWYKDVTSDTSFRYGDTITYAKGYDFLRTCQDVQDWGCGTGGFRRFFSASSPKYIGLDGSDTPCSDMKVDLETYTGTVDGVFMRHVLEHNEHWKTILQNALQTFQRKMCLVLFTPFTDTTHVIAQNAAHGVDVPDISFRKEDITSLFDSSIDWSVETLTTDTGYGVEHVFYLNKKWLAFYTVHFGSHPYVPACPSTKYACYYFTNTNDVCLDGTGWIRVHLHVSTDSDDDACMKAKRVKILPHTYTQLFEYTHTCYLDSKYAHVDETAIEDVVSSDYTLMFRGHWNTNVWDELNESILQERYMKEKDRYRTYIQKQLDFGYSETSSPMIMGGFIVRNMHRTRIFDETWFRHVQECGLNDQISLFFVRQMFPTEWFRLTETWPSFLKHSAS